MATDGDINIYLESPPFLGALYLQSYNPSMLELVHLR